MTDNLISPELAWLHRKKWREILIVSDENRVCADRADFAQEGEAQHECNLSVRFSPLFALSDAEFGAFVYST
jgi:ubiquinone biosynthesis protein UbiJ